MSAMRLRDFGVFGKMSRMRNLGLFDGRNFRKATGNIPSGNYLQRQT